MIGNKGFRRLLVWQKTDEFAFEIYKITKCFPKDEIYGITSQLRRAGLSVPVNIVEGHARQGKGEIKQFLRVALASLAEVEYLLEFSKRLEYIGVEEFKKVELMREETGRILWSFYKAQ